MKWVLVIGAVWVAASIVLTAAWGIFFWVFKHETDDDPFEEEDEP